MTEKKHIEAKDVIMRARKADGELYLFAAVNEVSLQIGVGMVETTGIGSGNWSSFVYDKLISWAANLTGVCVLEDLIDTAWTMNEITAIPLEFKKLEVEFLFTDTNNKVTTWTGQVLLPDLGITASIGDGGTPAMWNCKLQGSGPLVVSEVSERKDYLLLEDGGKQLLEDEGRTLLG